MWYKGAVVSFCRLQQSASDYLHVNDNCSCSCKPERSGPLCAAGLIPRPSPSHSPTRQTPWFRTGRNGWVAGIPAEPWLLLISRSTALMMMMMMMVSQPSGHHTAIEFILAFIYVLPFNTRGMTRLREGWAIDLKKSKTIEWKPKLFISIWTFSYIPL